MQHEYSGGVQLYHTPILTAFLKHKHRFYDYLQYLHFGTFVRLPTLYTTCDDVLDCLRNTCASMREHQDICERARRIYG